MGINQILPFATGVGANVTPQADYAADATTATGFVAGIAEADKLNKVWRQSSFIAAGIAQWLADNGADVLDDGNLAALVAMMQARLANKETLADDNGATGIGYGLTNVAAALTLLSSNVAAAKQSKVKMSRPAFLDQFLGGSRDGIHDGFFGRGMLTDETINVVTEQSLVGNYGAGADTLTLTNALHFLPGATCTVKHDNGDYGTYAIVSKAGSAIAITPPLASVCTAATARIERTWFNRAHPGKFAMRQIAQRLARSTEFNASSPNDGREIIANFSANDLVAKGGTTVTNYAPSNVGETGTVASLVRFPMGQTAFVENIDAIGDGVNTGFFTVSGGATSVVKFMARINSASSFVAKIVDSAGVVRGSLRMPPVGITASRMYEFPVDLRAADSVQFVMECDTYAGPGGVFAVGMVQCFKQPDTVGRIIENRNATIVVLGDSWVAGDLGNTPEREPITTQLALELPDATIINAGVGGNTVLEMLTRFDADVVPHKPDYVIIDPGTNDVYRLTIDEFLTGYRQLLNRIYAISARPIILGVPALAQSDGEAPGAEWALNDRARTFAKGVYDLQGSLSTFVTSGSNVNGSWTKFADGTMLARHTVNVATVAANTIAGTVWTFPIAFVGVPEVIPAVASYDTNQLVSVGHKDTIATTSTIALVSGVGPVNMSIDCVAYGRWKA